MTDSTNTLGKYKIIREIARSNDVVYEAVDSVVGRRVALKELIFPPNITGEQHRERIQRFYREARAAAQLTHPNIVTIYEAGEDKGRHFIAMEYLEGQTLRDVLRVRGLLSVEEVVRIGKDLCHALDCAHRQNVIHRDVKPDNIYILSDGRVKLADFGIARLTAEPSITADGQVLGTPSYMSPEQIAGKPVDGRSDLFSLGIVLYEMLTGRKPFIGESIVTITYNILNSQPDFPAGIPPYLAAILNKAMAKRPEDRFSTAQQMEQALATPGQIVSAPVVSSYSQAAPQPTIMQPIPPIVPPPASPQVQPSPKPQPVHRAPRPQGGMSSQFRGLFWNCVLAVLLAGIVGFGVWMVSAYNDKAHAQQYYDIGVQLGNQAVELQNAGRFTESVIKYQDAEKNFKEAAQASPDSEIGRHAKEEASKMAAAQAKLSGTATEGQGLSEKQLKDATDTNQRAIQENPDNPEPYYQQGLLYEGQARSNNFDSDHMIQALNYYKNSQQASPASDTGKKASNAYAKLCLDAGVAYWKAGDKDQARKYWNLAVTNAGETPAAQTAESYLNQMDITPNNQ